MPFMSPIVNCESAGINTTAKEVSLSFSISSSTDHGHHVVSGHSIDHRPQHGLQWQYRPQNQHSPQL